MKLLETSWIKKDIAVRNYFTEFCTDRYYFFYDGECYKFGIVVGDCCQDKELVVSIPGRKYIRLFFTEPRYPKQEYIDNRESIINADAPCQNIYGNCFLGTVRCYIYQRPRDRKYIESYTMALCCPEETKNLILARLEKGVEGLIHEEK